MDGLDPDERAAMLKSLAAGSPLPVAGGLPGDEERKISGRAPPLSAQARTGRPSLLGDR
jgi:hypothetical protein